MAMRIRTQNGNRAERRLGSRCQMRICRVRSASRLRPIRKEGKRVRKACDNAYSKVSGTSQRLSEK